MSPKQYGAAQQRLIARVDRREHNTHRQMKPSVLRRRKAEQVSA